MIKYDRVVCDVPCSGDGTIRKNPNVWQEWTPGPGNARHHVQWAILKRSAELTAKGGVIAYSSCAMNPIENEAVVQRLLRAAAGGFEVEVMEKPPADLEFAEGHAHWKVLDSEMTVYERYEDVIERFRTQIHPEMFPSQNGEYREQLKRCARLLPHLNNDGGFFVAMLRKTVDELPWEEAERERKAAEDYKEKKQNFRTPVREMGSKKLVHSVWQKPAYFEVKEGEDEEDFRRCLAFYGLDGLVGVDNFLGNQRARLVNDSLKELIRVNAKDNRTKNFYHAGLEIFRKETKSHFAGDLPKWKPTVDCGTYSFLDMMDNDTNPRVIKLDEDLFRELMELSLGQGDGVVFNGEGPGGKISEVQVSKPLKEKLHAFENGPGNVKIAVYAKEESSEDKPEVLLECFGFLGRQTIKLRMMPEQEYHAKMVILGTDN